MVTADTDKPEAPNDFFASVFISKVSAPVISGRVQGGSRCRSSQQLGEFNTWKSMGPERLYPRLLRELTDIVARLHF